MLKYPLSRERSRHGKLRVYVKEFADGPDGRPVLRQRHRLPDGLAEDSPAFIAAYQAICLRIEAGSAPAAARRQAAAERAARPEGKISAAVDSLDWLIKTFLIKAGQDWAPATRYRMERSLTALRDERTDQGYKRGLCRFDTLSNEHVDDMVKAWKRRHGQGEARLRLQHVSQLYNWARARQHVTYNPCTGLKVSGLSAGKAKRGTVAWQAEDAALWRRVFPLGSQARTTMELGYLGGLRRSDLCRIGPGDIRDRDSANWRLAWREHKRRGIEPKLRRPVLFGELREALLAAEQALPGGRYYLGLGRTTNDERQRGPLWAENLLQKAFLRWRSHAEAVTRRDLSHLTLHGLRAGGAVRLCLLRWTPQEIQGWGGWKDLKMVLKYIEDLDREGLADERVREHNAGIAAAPRLKVVKAEP